MPPYLTDDAVCLRVTDFSETSQIAAMLTRAHGLVPLIAKGSKRQTKKGHSGTVSGPLDLLARGELVFIPAKSGGGQLGTLAAWELTDPRNGIRSSLAAFNAAMVLAELTTLLLHPHDPHPDLYDELNAALLLVATDQRPRAVVAYAKAALVAAGYAPHLDACTRCGAAIYPDSTLRYSPAAGGVLCGKCPVQGPSMQTTGRIAIALNRLDLPSVVAAAPSPRPADPQALLQALLLLLSHAETVADKPVRTRALLPTIFLLPPPHM